MNKRLLLSLYDRSGLGAYMPVDLKGHELEVEEHMEKFAELVAKECADLCDRFQARDVGMQPAECAAAIRKMFGVG